MAPTTYFRNTTTIQNIDPGALWQLTPQGYVLVDDDQYICAPPNQANHFV